MFLNSPKILFYAVMVVSTLLAASSNTWLGAWMGLEINMLAFIPLMSDNNNQMASEAALKYFLVQALASSVLLFAALLTSMESFLSIKGLSYAPNLMIVSSLVMKSGAAPFHLWFVLMMEGLTWLNALILMTWQKLAPLAIVSYLVNSWISFVIAFLCVSAGSLGGLNQSSLRKLMAYSSINHLGWILAAMNFSEALWLTYFLIYCFLSVSVVSYFLSLSLVNINQLVSFPNSSGNFSVVFFLCFLSLGGLPPFLGFFPKWSVIQQLVNIELIFPVIVLSLFSLVTLFFYLRLCYSAFMVSSSMLSSSIIIPSSLSLRVSGLLMSVISLTGFLAISLCFC